MPTLVRRSLACAFLGSAIAAFPLTPASAEVSVSGEIRGQMSGVIGRYTQEPISRRPYPFQADNSVVGRSYARLDLRGGIWTRGETEVAVEAGVYSNLNSAYDHSRHPRGVVGFDNFNLNLTRIRDEAVLDFDRLALTVSGPAGRLEAGWAAGISETTAVTAPRDWGLGGVVGDFPYFLDLPQDVGFVSASALASANTGPRASYYSPRIHGLRLGISYQPDTRNTGFSLRHGGLQEGLKGRRRLADGGFEAAGSGFHDVVEAGLDYESDLGFARLRASLAVIAGQAVESPSGARFSHLRSLQAGLALERGPHSLGVGYVGARDSGYSLATFPDQRENQFDVHAAYQRRLARWTLGAGFLYSDDAGDPSEQSSRQLLVLSAGARYRLSEHGDLGVELDHVHTMSADFGDFRNYILAVQLRWRFEPRLVSP